MKLILAGTAMVVSSVVMGQTDPHFSTFSATTPDVNIGAAGMMNENLRAFTNYRSQWRSLGIEPYKTFSFQVDGNANRKTRGKRSYMGYGLQFHSDNSSGTLKEQVIKGVISSGVAVTDNSMVALGISVAYQQRSLNMSNLTFSSQWAGSGFNPSLASGETSIDRKIGVADLGAGLFYKIKFQENYLFAGFDVNHLTRPNVSMTGADERLYRTYSGVLGAHIAPDNLKFSFHPNVWVISQGPNTVANFGGEVKYALQKPSMQLDFVPEVSAGLGAYYRTNDALYMVAMLNYDLYSLGVAWDVTLSDLRVDGGYNGSFEIMLKGRLFYGSRSENAFFK